MKKKFIKVFSVICLVCILMLTTLSACNNSSDKLVYDVTSYNTYDSQINKIMGLNLN